MTYALIDNSTLTAAQRITGDAPTKSNDSVDTDIVALENLVQATLFYDQLVAVDDYIDEYRDARKSAFPELIFLDKSEYNLEAIESSAQQEAQKIQPEIRGGEFANQDFKSLMELLQTHIICTWDISSSVYNLTLKCLSDSDQEFEKYGNIAAAIFSELTDASESGHRSNSDVTLVDRFGNRINKGYRVPDAKWGDGSSTGEASGAIKAFVASLVWLANRSIFYSLAAKYLQADTFLYPIRQAYQQHYISQTCNYGQDYARHIVEHFSTSMSHDLVEVHNGGMASATSTSLPVFSAWLAKETGDPTRILDAAQNIRDETEFVETREQLREVRRLLDEEDIGSANKSARKILKDIQKASSAIRTKYGIETRQGIPTTKLVRVYNSYAALQGLPPAPDLGFKIKTPEFLRGLSQPKGFASVYRNLTSDLSTIWSLGEARDILGSKVAIDEDALAYNPKKEQPKYRNSHSSFKSPM